MMRTLGQLPPHELSVVLREYGYLEEADALDEQIDLVFKNALSFSSIDMDSIFKPQIPAWRHTGHAFGYIPAAAPGSDLLPIKHAGNIDPDEDLRHERITIRLDTLRIADYPGKGIHHILFDFRAQNHAKEFLENVRFSQTYRAQEGQSVGLIGYPVFIGLHVGDEGVAFECSTLNTKNEQEEALVEFLDSEVFKNGLRLASIAQPAIAPLTAMAANITKMLAGRNRNVAVQNFSLGLDFSSGPGGARLAQGLYIGVQIPEAEKVAWKWSEWVYDQANGHIVKQSEPDQLIPYNFIAFKVTRYQED